MNLEILKALADYRNFKKYLFEQILAQVKEYLEKRYIEQ